MANEMLSRVFLCIERCGVENVAPTFYDRKSIPMEATGKGRVFHVTALMHC